MLSRQFLEAEIDTETKELQIAESCDALKKIGCIGSFDFLNPKCLYTIIEKIISFQNLKMSVNTITRKINRNSSLNSQALTPSPFKIFLIGMMGSGKSYWAEKLKKKLKVPAYDLDSLVEMMEEKTVAEIFEEDGEEYFRQAEAKMLRLFSEKKQYILSCGGGTACYNDNMKWMNNHGITIWLDEPVEILVERLSKEKSQRPLIKNLDHSALRDFLNEKLEEREGYYKQAAHRLSNGNLNEIFFTTLLKEYA